MTTWKGPGAPFKAQKGPAFSLEYVLPGNKMNQHPAIKMPVPKWSVVCRVFHSRLRYKIILPLSSTETSVSVACDLISQTKTRYMAVWRNRLAPGSVFSLKSAGKTAWGLSCRTFLITGLCLAFTFTSMVNSPATQMSARVSIAVTTHAAAHRRQRAGRRLLLHTRPAPLPGRKGLCY